MSFLNLMRNKLKPKEVNEALTKAVQKEPPDFSSSDEGKVLRVNSSGELEWAETSAELPSYSSSDEGKILGVDSSGELEWRDENAELPTYSSSDENKVLSVDSSGELEWKSISQGGVTFRESTCTISPKEGETDGTHLVLTFDNETPIELLYSEYSTKKSVKWLKIEYSNGNWNVYSANQVYRENTLYYFDELVNSQHYDALVEYEVTSFVFVKESTRKRKSKNNKILFTV